MGEAPGSPPRDRRLSLVAARQHGVVSLDQLRATGLADSAIRSRVAAGRLHRLHSGVFALGAPPRDRDAQLMAAVLACGPGTLVSHASAADLHGLIRAAAGVDVTSANRAGRDRPGIRVHRAGGLVAGDRTSIRGIPVTGVARTLVDLASVVGPRDLEQALQRAELARLLNPHALEDALVRARHRAGSGRLRALWLELEAEPRLPRSVLEERMLALIRDARLPWPQVNAWVAAGTARFQGDFVWRDRRLIVETDGRAAHGTRRAFERDRRRDQALMLAGWRVARFTWRQVVDEPAGTGTALRALLHMGVDG